MMKSLSPYIARWMTNRETARVVHTIRAAGDEEKVEAATPLEAAAAARVAEDAADLLRGRQEATWLAYGCAS
jgi:hypothetical protein